MPRYLIEIIFNHAWREQGLSIMPIYSIEIIFNQAMRKLRLRLNFHLYEEVSKKLKYIIIAGYLVRYLKCLLWFIPKLLFFL